MAAIAICIGFGAPENKVSHCFHCWAIYLPWSDGTRCHDLSFLNVEPTFSLSSFTFIKRLFSSSSLSAYLRLLIFLLAILIPACASSSSAFLTMYSAYKLDKQGDNIQPWHTPFPIWNQSVVPCPVLTVAFQVSQEAGQVVWYSNLFQNFPEFIVKHIVKGFGIVKSISLFHCIIITDLI